MIDLKTEVYRICEFVESVVKRFDPKYDIPNKVKNEQI